MSKRENDIFANLIEGFHLMGGPPETYTMLMEAIFQVNMLFNTLMNIMEDI